ncbi:MAG: hypothetical protein OXT01_25405, partial [Rhodospirillaceae bacterium]|nr:hypothetical protein [Rhodospirillaceae bacterium]
MPIKDGCSGTITTRILTDGFGYTGKVPVFGEVGEAQRHAGVSSSLLQTLAVEQNEATNRLREQLDVRRLNDAYDRHIKSVTRRVRGLR